MLIFAKLKFRVKFELTVSLKEEDGQKVIFGKEKDETGKVDFF